MTGENERQPPFRLLAIDPGLAATGLLVADVIGYGQVHPVRGGAVITKAGEPLAQRLDTLRDGVLEWCNLAWGDFECDPLFVPQFQIVLEDPEGVIRRQAGVHRRPQVIHQLGVAVGWTWAAIRMFCEGYAYDPITVVGVSTWYPRQGRGFARKKGIVARAKAELTPVFGRVSEHVCMALALADWWSRNTAVRVWQEAA